MSINVRLRDQLRTNTSIAARRQHLPPPSLRHEQRRAVILHRSHAVHGVVSGSQEREWAGVCKDWSVRLEYSDSDLGTVESWRSGNCCWERDLGSQVWKLRLESITSCGGRVISALAVSSATNSQHILLGNLIIILSTLDLSNIILELLAHADSLFQVLII